MGTQSRGRHSPIGSWSHPSPSLTFGKGIGRSVSDNGWRWECAANLGGQRLCSTRAKCTAVSTQAQACSTQCSVRWHIAGGARQAVASSIRSLGVPYEVSWPLASDFGTAEWIYRLE